MCAIASGEGCPVLGFALISSALCPGVLSGAGAALEARGEGVGVAVVKSADLLQLDLFVTVDLAAKVDGTVFRGGKAFAGSKGVSSFQHPSIHLYRMVQLQKNQLQKDQLQKYQPQKNQHSGCLKPTPMP